MFLHKKKKKVMQLILRNSTILRKMDGEDWPDPLSEGWILKKFSNGKVIQPFHYISIEI